MPETTNQEMSSEMCIYTSLSNKPPQTMFSDKTALVTGVPSLERNKMKTTDRSWVLITGASSGFGEEFARQYAERGHALVLVARRLDRLQALADTLRQHHGTEVVVEQVDLSDIRAVVRLEERLRERGIAIDIL